MNCCTDIHGSQRMFPNDFSDPLTFRLAPPVGQFQFVLHIYTNAIHISLNCVFIANYKMLAC